jgi:FK506-binding protein 4/5
MDEDMEMPMGMGDEMMGGMNEEDMELPDEASIMKEGEEKEIGKLGLKKKLVKQGQGWETPENGDEVEGMFHVMKSIYPFFRLYSHYW